jgi:hypothetical protein
MLTKLSAARTTPPELKTNRTTRSRSEVFIIALRLTDEKNRSMWKRQDLRKEL